MAFVEPKFSKSRVNRAGERYARGIGAYGDLNEFLVDSQVIENWRAAHSYVINTFQANLRSRARKVDEDIVVAQRLKRFPTLIDKLQRFPSMQLARMHDIAGCRVILRDLEQLSAFRNAFLNSRFAHQRVSDDRYNYILNPKPSGYRGIHEVFRYVGLGRGKAWSGLHIEVQFRSQVQHAWATAVEIVDASTGDRAKFDDGRALATEFFRVTSELLARAHEGQVGCLQAASSSILLDRLDAVLEKKDFLTLLENARRTETRFIHGSVYVVLRSLTNGRFEVHPFADANSANRYYFQMERDYADDPDIDIVLVGAKDEDDLRYAFKNYFVNADDFVSLVMAARNTLR